MERRWPDRARQVVVTTTKDAKMAGFAAFVVSFGPSDLSRRAYFPEVSFSAAREMLRMLRIA
jgi:hypothetical protein